MYVVWMEVHGDSKTRNVYHRGSDLDLTRNVHGGYSIVHKNLGLGRILLQKFVGRASRASQATQTHAPHDHDVHFGSSLASGLAGYNTATVKPN